MRILYLGNADPATTSAQRGAALERLGHDVRFADIEGWSRKNAIADRINYRLGYRPIRRQAARWLLSKARDERFDLVWVDSGRQVSRTLVRELRERHGVVVNYNVDDPFGTRDGRMWDTYLQAVPEYSLVVVVREENVDEAKALGARHVRHVFRSYDPAVHRALELTTEEEARWASEVVFVGSWMPERGPFVAELVRLGVPLTIDGTRWHRAREWDVLQQYHRHDHLRGDEYVKALQTAKVCLGFLSKGNRDLHTQRSAEVPAIGSLFCAERTREHLEMFDDGRQALLWDDPEECAARCREALADEQRRRDIARAGQDRIRELRLSNDEVMADLIDHALEVSA